MKNLLIALALCALMAPGVLAENPTKDSLQTKVLLRQNTRIQELERRVALQAKAIGNLAVKIQRLEIRLSK